jgi:hypothetical protein
MSLLREFLRIDADRRAGHEALGGEIAHRRGRVEQLTVEARRRRDEMAVLEEGLGRLSGDISRMEDEILELEARREDHDRDATRRRSEALRSALAADAKASAQLAADYRRLRTGFAEERDRILAQPETGRMMDNYFQIETFLKDGAHPIPDAARKALARERQELLAKVGPLVAPPPVPDGVLRATLAWSGIEDPSPRAVVALGLKAPAEPDDATDLPATLLYGAFAAAAARFGEKAPRPVRRGEAFLFEIGSPDTGAEEAALELFLTLEEGLKKAAAAVSVRCELTGVFVDPRTAAEVFVSATGRE